MDLIETFAKAMAYLEEDEWERALKYLNQVEDDIPDDGEMQKFAGLLYQRIGEDAKSFKFLTQAQANLPDDPSLLLSLGYHYLDNALPDKAAAYFSQYLTEVPNSQDATLHLGRAYDLSGDRAQAQATLRAAVDIDPSALEPQLHLGRVLLLNKKYDAALQCFQTADIYHPGHFLAETGAKRAEAFLAKAVATNIETKSVEPATVVCVKFGTKYGPEYVNRLAAMARRFSSVELDFVCFTDDATGLEAGIRALPLPEENLAGWWNKLSLFRGDISGVGSHMLYFDLDVVITASIDPLLFYDSDFAIIDNPYTPSFNSSIMRFKTGARPDIWTDFSAEIADRLPGDQDWLALKVPDADLWPEGWCVLYRLHAAAGVPPGAKLVCFSWRPNPDDYPARWIKDYWF